MMTLLLAALISGCITTSGVYKITAYDKHGQLLDPNIQNIAEGRGVYTVRNALCMAHPVSMGSINGVISMGSESLICGTRDMGESETITCINGVRVMIINGVRVIDLVKLEGGNLERSCREFR